LIAYSATGAASSATGARLSVSATGAASSTATTSSVATYSAGASALLPQDAKETATITAKNNTNFFIFFCFKTINRSSLKSRQN
jgi:hypothetical protein